MVRSVPVVQWATDRSGVFTSSEGRGLQALGLRPGEVVGRTVAEVYRDQPGILAHWARAAAGESFSATDELGPVQFESHWGPLRDDAGEIVGVTGIALDVTDRLRAEAARKASELRAGTLERLAATGQLAAGVAHEINNPLTYVISSLDDALARLRAGGAAAAEVAERVAEARDGAERVRAIVGDLRVFARADGEERGACDAAAVVRSATHLVANEIRHRARLVTRLEPAPPVAIPERRLAQVLVNLLVNACQAIPEGRAGENEIRVTLRPERERVVLEVSDTGAGMAEEVRRRIFEPFFTTRPVGEGMGLGLAVSHAMVTEAGGELEAESAPGEGSTFRIRLPLAAAAAADGSAPQDAPSAPSAPEPDAARRLRVLLVDDEPLVGRAVARLLRDFEVDVETSASGALARVRAGARYDAFVCDLMMPDATGMDLHASVADVDAAAAARFVFLTGGAFTERARAFVASTAAPVLEKPVDPGALRAAVRAAAGAGDAA
jgi:PAS domain S-box-containing protein